MCLLLSLITYTYLTFTIVLELLGGVIAENISAVVLNPCGFRGHQAVRQTDSMMDNGEYILLLGTGEASTCTQLLEKVRIC